MSDTSGLILDRLNKVRAELAERGILDRMLPCLSEQQLLEFEHEYDVSIPNEYRSFLMLIGNGGPGPFYGLYPLHASTLIDPLPYSYSQSTEDVELLDHISAQLLQRDFPSGSELDTVRDSIEFGEVPGTLALAHYGCGTIERIVVSGEIAGSVLYDVSIDGLGIHARGQTFLDWYECWLSGQHATLWKLKDFSN